MLAQDKDTKPQPRTPIRSQQPGRQQERRRHSRCGSRLSWHPAIPKGANEVEPNLFRYTDPQGKTWIYRKIPFGVSEMGRKTR